MMEFDGEFTVDAPREEVWQYFNDPDILQDAAPGCKEMVLETSSKIRTTLEVGVGSVKPTFEVDAIVTECDEPGRLAVSASGQASRNSFQVTAWMELVDNGDGTTTVTWESTAEVSGIIASMGERALGSVVDKLVRDFFKDLEDHVNAGTPAEAQLEAAEEEAVEEAEELEASADVGVAGTAADAAETIQSQLGGADDRQRNALLYLVGGFVAGVLGKLLWDQLDSSDGGEKLQYALLGAVAVGVGKAIFDDAGSDATPTERTGDTATEGTSDPSPASPDTDGQEGLIDDPLDRLN